MFLFSIRNLMTRKTKSIFMIIAILIASLIIFLSYNVANQINEGIISTAAYYDTLIGPNGSSTDLVLNTLFFTGNPLGTIGHDVYEELKNHPHVNQIIPFASGDSYQGAKIIGTDSAFLTAKSFNSGGVFKDSFEATLGYDVAKRANLKVGDTFISAHGVGESGHDHGNSPYTVVGILNRTYTAYDNVIFTTVDSAWKAHEVPEENEEDMHALEEQHDNEIEQTNQHELEGDFTALLLRTTGPSAQMTLSNEINERGGMQAVNPATVLRTLMNNVNIATRIVYLLCIVISIMAFVIIYMIILMMLEDIKKDVSLMRLLGIHRSSIFLIILIQNLLISIIGIILGFLLTRLALVGINYVSMNMGIVINYLKVYSGEYWTMLLIILITLLPMQLGLSKLFRKEIKSYD